MGWFKTFEASVLTWTDLDSVSLNDLDAPAIARGRDSLVAGSTKSVAPWNRPSANPKWTGNFLR
jgi:hypothetical protein